jgi:hypothetical protein
MNAGFRLLGLTLSLLTMACGGGSDDSLDGEPIYFTEGRVTDSASAPISGAEVSVVLDTRKFAATTDGNGIYRLKLPQNFSYPSSFVGVVKKSGYLPNLLYFGSSGGKPTTSSSTSFTLATATDADVVFEKGLFVTHLGDDSFGGSANSQLQVPASGLAWFDKFAYTAAMKSKYRTLCLSMTARGVQSQSSNNDLISVSADGAPGTYAVQTLTDTDVAGGYSGLGNCFDVSRFLDGTPVQVQINSGTRNGSDYDDFEFINVVGKLMP